MFRRFTTFAKLVAPPSPSIKPALADRLYVDGTEVAGGRHEDGGSRSGEWRTERKKKKRDSSREQHEWRREIVEEKE